MKLTEVPVIDFKPFLLGSASERSAIARAIDRACRRIGFLVLVNHGVSPVLCDDVYTASHRFFDLPDEEKRKVEQWKDDVMRGYSPLLRESLAHSRDEMAPGDLKESFSIGPIDVDSSDAYFTNPNARPFFIENIWPNQPAWFRSSWETYYRAMSALAADVMKAFALALGLNEEFFQDKIDRHISVLRVINYPAQQVTPAPGQLRAGAHTDYGSLTILRQDGQPGGLQVRNDDGLWLDVPFVPNSFVINIGDLMMQWTNDQWRSTLHRVVNPPESVRGESRRQSLVFFHQPNYDAVIECIENCRQHGAPAKYPAVTSGAHLYSKFTKTTTYTASQ